MKGYGGGRLPHRLAIAAVAVAVTLALAACGGSPAKSSVHSTVTTRRPTTHRSTTTTSSSTTSTTVSNTSIDGPEIDTLPTVPGPSTTPSSPNLSTTSEQEAYLTEMFNDIQSVWEKVFSEAKATYSPAHLDLFSTPTVTTACGTESSDVGPFYCPGDKTVYLDVSFFKTMEAQFGLKGDFAEAYVVAHEMGHHIQNLVGISSRVAAADSSNPAGANALSVDVELQADCLAGVWAYSRYQRNLLNPGDIDQALQAAQTVGDDFLAKASGQPVEPDTFTHGTSAQRQQWFTTGYEKGDADACDTFSSS